MNKTPILSNGHKSEPISSNGQAVSIFTPLCQGSLFASLAGIPSHFLGVFTFFREASRKWVSRLTPMFTLTSLFANHCTSLIPACFLPPGWVWGAGISVESGILSVQGSLLWKSCSTMAWGGLAASSNTTLRVKGSTWLPDPADPFPWQVGLSRFSIR